MLPSPQTATWPLYTVGPQTTGVWGSALPVAAELEAAFVAAPDLVYMGANRVERGWVSEGLVLRFRASPDLSEADAREVALDLLDDAVPGVFSRAVGIVATLTSEVVAPTLVQTGQTITGAAAGVRSGLPWLTIGLVAIVAILLLRRAR